MATLVSAIDTDFTPAVGDFIAQASGAPATLLRKNSSGAAFVTVGAVSGNACIVSNPIAGAVYRFVGAGATVQADQ